MIGGMLAAGVAGRPLTPGQKPTLDCPFCHSISFHLGEKRAFLKHVVKFHAEEAASLLLDSKGVAQPARSNLMPSEGVPSVAAGPAPVVVRRGGTRDGPS